jgi:hypothetical protein
LVDKGYLKVVDSELEKYEFLEQKVPNWYKLEQKVPK